MKWWWPFEQKETKPKRDYVGEAMELQLEIAKIKAEADNIWDGVDKADRVAVERALERLTALTSEGRDVHLKMLTLVVEQHQHS